MAVFDLDGNFFGYVIKDAAPNIFKLQSTNIYQELEYPQAEQRIAALNQDIDIRSYWPNPKDPTVLAVLADPNFMPIEYEMKNMVDDENSYYVWVQEPEYDHETGLPTGRTVNGSELDEMASVIRYKMGRVPKRPSDEMYRIKAACELIARERAGLVDSANV